MINVVIIIAAIVAMVLGGLLFQHGLRWFIAHNNIRYVVAAAQGRQWKLIADAISMAYIRGRFRHREYVAVAALIAHEFLGTKEIADWTRYVASNAVLLDHYNRIKDGTWKSLNQYLVDQYNSDPEMISLEQSIAITVVAAFVFTMGMVLFFSVIH